MESNTKLVVVSDVTLLHSEIENTVLPLTVWGDRKAKELGLSYLSAASHVPSGEELGDLARLSETIAREWYRIPEASELIHEHIRIGEVFEPMLDFYLGRFLYYLHTLDSVLTANPHIVSVSILDAQEIASSSTGPFAPFEMRAVYDAVTLAAEKHGTTLHLEAPADVPNDHVFPQKKGSAVLAIYNFLIGLLPRKPRKVFASEYWWHVAPFITRMKEVELVFMERSEIRTIPFRDLIRHRIRFIHPLEKMPEELRAKALAKATSFEQDWKLIDAVLAHSDWFTYKGSNWYEPVRNALSYAVTTYSARVIADIDALKQIFTKEKIDLVLLRAGIGGRQHHFFVAGQLAPSLGIPSIELQHAVEVVDPNTVHSRLGTSYLAAYGAKTRDTMVANHEYASERIRAIGSPRFDRYLAQGESPSRSNVLSGFGLDPNKITVFAGMPAEIADLYFVHFDSYAVTKFFSDLRTLKSKCPNLQFILKFRSGNLKNEHRACISELFPEGGMYLSESEDPFMLMQCSDIVLSGNSTLMYEGVLAGRSVLLYPLRPHDSFFASQFADLADAPSTPEKLIEAVENLSDTTKREEAVSRSKKFLCEQYSFDGKSSERMLTFLREKLPPL